jgi:hypothetical protein
MSLRRARSQRYRCGSSGRGSAGLDLDPDYVRPRLLGYILRPDTNPVTTNVVPLCPWYDNVRKDNWTTAEFRTECENGEGLSPNYTFSQLEGYLLRP